MINLPLLARRLRKPVPRRTSVLFVCMGNICRSRMALSLALHRCPDLADFDSAGTGVGDRAEPIDPRAAALLLQRGVAPRPKARSRRVVAQDFERFDLVLAMDHDNRSSLLEMCPQDLRDRVGLLLDLAPGYEGQEVPDPYFGGPAAFERVFDLCERGVGGLAARLARAGPVAAPVKGA